MKHFLTRSRHGGLLVLALVLAILPLFLSNAFYYDVAIRIALNAIVVIGLNLLMGYTGQISLGHAGFYGLGAYASAVLTTHYNWPPLAALAAGAVATGLLALLLATSAVTALCSTRISADRMEQAAATPFVVYTGTAEPQRSLDGTVHGTRTVFEIQCWASTRAAADALAAAVMAALDAQHQYCTGPVAGFDAELDLEAALLTCDWWS